MSNKKKIFSNLRIRRFKAFTIDLVFVLIIMSIMFKVAGFPNFPAVFEQMKVVNNSGNVVNQENVIKMMSLFNKAYIQALLIWFSYDVISMLILKGSTPGKLMMKLQLIPANNKRGKIAGGMLVVVRSFIKVFTMYLFQGIPFLLSTVSVFADEQSLTGYDRLARLIVKDKGKKDLIWNEQ